MRLRRKTIFEQAILFIYALCMYFNSYFYMMWESYGNLILTLFLKAMSYICIILPFFLLMLNKTRLKIKVGEAIVLLMALSLELHMSLLGTTYRSLDLNTLKTIIGLLGILLLSLKQRRKLFEYMLKIFAIFVLPSLIYYLLASIGINLPSVVLQSDHEGKRAVGTYYSKYPFGLIAHTITGVDRYCGVFDEPGVIGTLAAFFIAAGYKRCDKKWLALIFIEGLFSLSMAFYLLLVIFVIVEAFVQGAKKFAAVLLAVMCGFMFFINIEFENPQMKAIQARIDITSAFLIEDNRTGKSFDGEYDRFLEDGGANVVFGYGKSAAIHNPRMTNSSSYKRIVYEHGVLGTILYLGIFIMMALSYKFRASTLPFILVFLASFYQRPYIFNLQFITLFLAGLSYAAIPEKNYALLSDKFTQKGKAL